MASGFGNMATTSDEFEDALEIENELKLENSTIKGSQQWQHSSINIAVLGQPKSGKSSFINRLRNVQSNARGAAKVDDSVSDSQIREFKYPANSKISIHEIPGLKMQDVKGSTRQNDVDFDQFDFFLVLSEKSFVESDNWFIKEVMQTEKPCFFVRTCVGRSVNETKTATLKTSKSGILEGIRTSCKKNLDVYGATNPTVFLVDSDDISNNFFEFGDLQDQLFTLAESAKIGNIQFSFKLTHTEELMISKRELLGKRIRDKGLQASKAKTGNERKKILKQEILFQQQIFGIDIDNLKKYVALYALPSSTISKFDIYFEARGHGSTTNIINLAKIDDRGRSRNVYWCFRQVSDSMVRIKGGEEATYICKQCKQILEGSLTMVFNLRESLNKEVLTYLVIKKQTERV